MNTENQTPPSIPPAIPIAGQGRPALEGPDEQLPVTSMTAAVEAILRQPRRVLRQLSEPGGGRVILFMLGIVVAASIVYGAVMGSFSMGSQLWAAPLKLSLGLLVSALICLPSLYIFSCLSGSRARPIEVVGMLAGLLTLSTLLLIGFAPVAGLFSQSSNSLGWMGTLHLLFWFVSLGFGIRFLHHGFTHAQARSKAGLYTWAIIFLLVTLQMSAALRPLVGTAKTLLPEEKRFFLVHWIDCLEERHDRPESGADGYR
jgi:hypothetical protein